VAGLATIGVLTLAPTVAQATVGPTLSGSFPTEVTVGLSYTGTLTLGRSNSAPDDVAFNQVCNDGDPAPCATVPPAPPQRGIEMTPSCSNLSGGFCTPAGAELGVFGFAAAATGAIGAGSPAGTLCPNFTVAPIAGDSFGTVRFTPVSGSVVLPSNAATCIITFSFTVLKSPANDQNPFVLGKQTGQTLGATQCIQPCGPGNLSNAARATSAGTTVLRSTPRAITTIASPGGEVNQLTDQATVTGLVNPVAGATVTFKLFGPNTAPNCAAGTEVFSSQKVVTLSGTTATATSDAFPSPVLGGYRWIATYDGDLNNAPISGLCGEATETLTVGPPPKTPPPGTTPPPPPEVCTPPPGPAPPGGKLCTTPPKECTTPPGPAPAGGVLCAKGTAAIRGRTGCAGSKFSVVVSGREIESVTFAMDGKVVRRLTKPNSGTRFSLPVNPPRLGLGVHRVVARTIFRKQSGTKARTLRVTFSKCSRRASAPAFTG
jgi:hypothetical protein